MVLSGAILYFDVLHLVVCGTLLCPLEKMFFADFSFLASIVM